MSDDLKEIATRAIANYMHQELFEITNSAEVLPWLKDQASAIMAIVDSAIVQTKNSPLRKSL